MAMPTVPQFVPGDYCLKCRGCCVFTHADSHWTPKVNADEVRALQQRSGIEGQDLAKNGGLITAPHGDQHRCVLLNEGDHHCQAYDVRPFECRIYPFVLSSSGGDVSLEAHLACPFVLEKQGSRPWDDHVATLRAFFTHPEVRRYVRSHKNVLVDYSPFARELKALFSVRSVLPERLMQAQEGFHQACASSSVTLSSRAFVSMFLWHDVFDFIIEEIDNALCVFAYQPAGAFLYLPPLGEKVTGAVTAQAFRRLRELTGPGSTNRIENVAEEELKLFDPQRYQITERPAEYVYEREAIAALRGHDYKSQRHEVNLAQRAGALTIRPYEPADRRECQELFERWLDRKAQGDDDDFARAVSADSRYAHEILWDSSGQLDLVGRVVEVDGMVRGYTFGAPINAETFCVLVEIADRGIKGLAAFLFHSLASDPELEGYRYLNTMDDLGEVSLRRAKEAWRPAKKLKIYSVIERRSCSD